MVGVLIYFCQVTAAYCSCVRGAMLYACGCWPLKQTDLDRLLRNKRAMLRWMCAVKHTDVINTQDLRLRLGIDDLDVALRQKRLRWFGHVVFRLDNLCKECNNRNAC